ncbi:PP2C family protein-serine/threonine phosphatase [[Acholeplasma] multilocale]|uniref:PP2C family protein-serine/threonine phosphatase n=1 Tax=[Acholeplasma] multilocale TaxID=264638 RepID=UPI00244E0265|nr:protein phosphatase 2C domain-containing protein [[Acholeplasma] multilocale]
MIKSLYWRIGNDMKYKVAEISDIGNYRKSNQDYLGFEKNKDGDLFGIVCDGMGGHAHGDVASKIAVKKFIELFKEETFSNKTKEEINKWLRECIESILISMKMHASEREETLDMGTTLTAVLFANNQGYVINVGDSRTYKYTNDKVYQITKDQNLWNSTPEEERNKINQEGAFGARFNEVTYWKVLTSALGPNKTLKIDTYLIKEPKGLYFLTTDGIHDYVDEETLKEIVESNEKLKRKCQDLVDYAKGNLSTDNLSILMIEVS